MSAATSKEIDNFPLLPSTNASSRRSSYCSGLPSIISSCDSLSNSQPTSRKISRNAMRKFKSNSMDATSSEERQRLLVYQEIDMYRAKLLEQEISEQRNVVRNFTHKSKNRNFFKKKL